MYRKSALLGLKPLGFASTCKFIERFQKHPTKSVSLWNPKNGAKCERKILADKKLSRALLIFLYINNPSEECFIGFKAHARDVLSVSCF